MEGIGHVQEEAEYCSSHPILISPRLFIPSISVFFGEFKVSTAGIDSEVFIHRNRWNSVDRPTEDTRKGGRKRRKEKAFSAEVWLPLRLLGGK